MMGQNKWKEKKNRNKDERESGHGKRFFKKMKKRIKIHSF